MARAYTGNYDIVSLRNAYHGGSTLTMGTTGNRGWKFNVPHSFGVHHAITPDPYRGLWGRDDPDAGKKYAADIKNLIDFATSGQLAAFIAESIQGVGGCVVFPENYLKHAYEHVRATGGLCIADEVQAGFGRTGSHYWGFETQDVIPDIEFVEDRKPNSRGTEQAQGKTQHHRRRPRQRIITRDRAGERSTIKGTGERRMRASDGNLQRNGTSSRQRRTLGTNDPFLAAHVHQRTRRRFSPRSPRPLARGFVMARNQKIYNDQLHVLPECGRLQHLVIWLLVSGCRNRFSIHWMVFAFSARDTN